MANLRLSVGVEHDRSHEPGVTDTDLWQESSALHWYDPRTRIGGYQHLSLLRQRKIADVNSFISVGNEIVDRYQNLDLGLPSADFSDIALGPLTLRSLTPLTRHSVVIQGGRVRAEVELNAVLGPHWMNYHDAKNHWESFGRMSGTVHVREQPVTVAGWFFLNRSWGDRDYSRMLSYRIVTAIFDRNLIFRLFQSTRPDGYVEHGYVIDGEHSYEVESVESEFGIASDGVNTLGAKLTVWTKQGPAYRLSGQAVASDVLTQRGGFMYSIAHSVFDCGGRVGTGFLSAAELKQPTTTLKDQLGLP